MVLALISTALTNFGASAEGKVVIAHRGASGYLPEHTLEAYAMAHAQGADYIEPDLVLTKDGVFICLHDIHLGPTTDVELRFPNRKRADGHWYPADFMLAEIKQLRVHERLPDRFPMDQSAFEVPTFEEMIELIQGLNLTTGREAGIYPEIKAPAWHEKEGLPMEKAVLDVLTKYGYTGPDSKVFLQCFEAEPLKKIRHELGSSIPIVMLVGGGAAARQLLSEKGLDEVATFANGIGPSKTLIEAKPEIVKWAHDRDLKVHPYTFRKDNYPERKYDSYAAELEQFFKQYDVDGLFTDFPDIAVHYLAHN
ncbi:MAG: glycerophosphodiester phosphodiesterase [Candidatus Hydrogenedentes bacterium]|nr:glycerophosphodiester phosphodiesterase [Candidatus Hydrogenedentota bacterium]